MNTLEIEFLPINKDQWLSDTEKFKNGTPSNYIIFKVLPGKGATHWECLYQDRNSIIMEFNTPVLEGKRDALASDEITKLYPNILSVLQGVDKKDVVRYLKNGTFPKNILCTTDAYSKKVKPAIDECGFDLYKDFFLLIDECDKLTTECDFRSDIVLPIDNFFNFNGKAMISATAMSPSDPRFLEHGFKILKIKPTYEYKKNITLINTNNVIYALVKKLRESVDRKVFIFINSTDLIYELIKALGIQDNSKIYCAENSVSKLKKMGNRNSNTRLGDFAQYNFFTSRFFSAVDIKINETPDVILVTHVYRAQYTMLDPYSDSIQIEGRLRNGSSSITHISNFNSKIESKIESNAKKFILDNIEGYKLLKKVKDDALEENKDVTVFDQSLKRADFGKYIRSNGGINYFMLDNYMLDEKVKGYYKGKDRFIKAYQETEYFTPIIEDQNFIYTDREILSEQTKLTKIEINRNIATGLHRAECAKNSGYIIFNFNNNPYDLRHQFPEFSEIYDALGFDKMEKLNFEESKLKSAFNKFKKQRSLLNPEFIAEMKFLYKIGDKPLKKDFLNTIQDIYVKYNIDRKAKYTDISEYYNVSESTTNIGGKKQKIWVIKGIKTI